MTYEDIVVTVEDGVATIAINRPDHANKLRFQTARELLEAFRAVRETPSIDVAILTGTGDKFFCIGGEHEELESLDYSSVMPVIDLYEFIDTMPKPVIAAVNGFAVGGGNVLQVVCDLAVAAPHAVFRQVGPMVGSFDAGYGTWYLEETIGRRRAKEMWYLNSKYTAEQALEMGLVNEIADEPRRASRRDRPDPAPARSVRAGRAQDRLLGAPHGSRRPGSARARPAPHRLPEHAGGRGDVDVVRGAAASPIGAGSTGELDQPGPRVLPRGRRQGCRRRPRDLPASLPDARSALSGAGLHDPRPGHR